MDGAILVEVDSERELRRVDGTWMVSDGGRAIRVHFPDEGEGPRGRLVEVSCRMRCFAPHERGLGYIVVRGFVMEHATNQFPSGFYNDPATGKCFPQAGALGCRGGHHWIIEDNIIR